MLEKKEAAQRDRLDFGRDEAMLKPVSGDQIAMTAAATSDRRIPMECDPG